MNDIEFVNTSKRFVDTPYALGDPSKGWDCINSLIEIFCRLGVDFPRQFGDWNESNYAERWNRDEKEARKVLRAFLFSLGDPINCNFAIRGDLFLFEDPDHDIPMFPGVYLGNGNILLTLGTKKGTRVVSLGVIKKYLKEVRRLIS